LADENSYSISGRVLSIKDSTAIPFAHLYIKKSNTGSISNEKGEFNLFINKESITDTLIISAIGYKNEKYCISEIINSSKVYLLSEQIYEIREITVSPVNCKEIINNLFARIKDNYPDKPTILEAYTRQMIIENQNYSRYLEAALTIYNPSYQLINNGSASENQIMLKSAKASLDKTNSNLKLNVNTSELIDKIFVAKTFDFIKNLSIDELKFESIVHFNNRDIYLIVIRPSEKSSYYGKIYIDKESYALVSLQIKQDLNFERKAKAYLKKFVNVTYKFKVYSLRLDFLPMEDLWNLSYLQDSYDIDVFTDDKETLNLNLEFINDIFINEVINKDVKQINKSDRINPKKDLYSQPNILDDKIWDNYNKIQPPNSIK